MSHLERPRHILMTADTIGGVWTYVMELAQGLCARGVEITLAAMGAEPSERQHAQAQAVDGLELYSRPYALEWMDDPWDDLSAAAGWLTALAERTRPELVHLNTLAQGALGWRAPVLTVGHSCVMSWFEAVHDDPAPDGWGRYRDLVQSSLQASDMVVAPSATMMQALQRHYGPLSKTRVIYNGRDPRGFEPGDKQPGVLSAGRLWDEAKNVRAVTEAARQIRWPVFVAGSPTHPDGGTVALDAVEVLGRLHPDQLARWYACTMIYALPARYEPFGLTALEAALAGNALVLGDIASLREILERLRHLRRPRRPRPPRRRGQQAHRRQPAPPVAGRPGTHPRAATVGGGHGRPLHGAVPRDDRRGLGGRGRNLPTARANLMRIVMFYHSLVSDWNHGNAHFLRGVVSELIERGHDVSVYEPRDGWSLTNLLEEYGEPARQAFHQAYPRLESTFYDPARLDLDRALDGADLVVVHEWNDHDVVARIGEYRRASKRFKLLFHDTHHRSVSKPREMHDYDLRHYDGVLAFGQVIRDIYIERGWADNAWTWHEAADVRVFEPRLSPEHDGEVVWIGNWGDDERTDELFDFLLRPIEELDLGATVHGVRYPDEAVARLKRAGIRYRGWLPNFRVPAAFARHRFTVHVPRRFYVTSLPGIPTIRPFEAMACGIPLVCSPWEDAEGLFRRGHDHLVARTGKEMQKTMRQLVHDDDMAAELAANGRETILKRHTCAHRVDELMGVCRELGIDT